MLLRVYESCNHEMARLLSMCEVCGLIMTKRSFERHHCFDVHEEDRIDSSQEDMDVDTVMGDATNELY